MLPNDEMRLDVGTAEEPDICVQVSYFFLVPIRLLSVHCCVIAVFYAKSF